MSFFDTLQEATQQERHALFNLPIIVDALQGKDGHTNLCTCFTISSPRFL